MIVNPVFSFWFVIPVAALLTILLAWHESRKPHRFLVARTIAVVLMMLAFTCLVLKPSYQTEKSSNIILLTPEYSRKKVDSLLLRYPDVFLMHLDSTLPYKNSNQLTNDALTERGDEIKIVIGQGIPRHSLDKMENKAFDFFPTLSPEGITGLFVSNVNITNRKNILSGTLDSKNGKGWIALRGPGGKEDSTAVKNTGQNNFELSFFPKQPGDFLYSLTIHDGITAHDEIVPVHVDPERPLQILFLHSYPNFETQYLKNFLAKKKHSLVLRYQLSKNKFRYEYFNHDQAPIERITPALLDSFDLVVADEGALSSLSTIEKDVLERSLFSGLGLLLLTPIDSKNLAAFFPFERTTVKSDTAVLQIGSRQLSFPARKLRIAYNPTTVPVHKNKTGIVSGYTLRGAGKIGFQLLQETYRLALSGDSISYAELWSPLLEQISRTSGKPSKIRMLTPFPVYENEPIDIEVISRTENISLMDDGIPLPLKEDVTFDNIWSARTWASEPGWHRLEAGDGTALQYYVSRPTEWKTLRLVNQQNENKIYPRTSSERQSEKIESRKEIPPLIFYILVLLTSGFIWLAPKL